jgi:hypothetical protein
MIKLIRKIFFTDKTPILPNAEPKIWYQLDLCLENSNISEIFTIYENGSDRLKADVVRYLHAINNYESITFYCAQNTDHYLSHYVQGIINSNLSQKSRGSRPANETSATQFRNMHEYATIAVNNFHNALAMNDQDINIYTDLMIPMLYLNAEKQQFLDYAETASALTTYNFRLFTQTLLSLTEKWGGSHEMMFNFAKKISDNSDSGAAHHCLIAYAHTERWLYFGMNDETTGQKLYFKNPVVQTEIINAYEKFVKGRNSSKHRTCFLASHYFALCFYHMNDETRFSQEYNYLNHCLELNTYPWCYLNGKRDGKIKKIDKMIKRAKK